MAHRKPTRRRSRQRLRPLADADRWAAQIEADRGKSVTTEQQDAIDWIKSLRTNPINVSAAGISNSRGLTVQDVLLKQTHELRQWGANLSLMDKKKPEAGDNGDLPEEVTRRMQWKDHTGKPIILDRPISPTTSYRDRKEMLKYPAIRLALAARNAYTLRAFGQYSIQSTDQIAKAMGRHQCDLVLKPAISSGLSAVPWGFSPNELVFERRDVRLQIPEQDDGPQPAPAATTDADGKPVPAQTVQPVRRTREVVVKDAVVITRCKDLMPHKTEIYVQGPLNEFYGLRYMQDDEQKVSSLASYVVTHNGPYGQMYGESAFDGIKPFWYSAMAVGMFCMYYLERKGDPPARGYAPPVSGFDENNTAVPGVRLLAEAHNRGRTSGGIFLPSVFDGNGNRLFEYDLLRDDQRADMFRSYQEHLIRQMLWGILIPDGSLFQNSRVGSFAASATYADVAMNLREIDLGEQEEYFNEYLLKKTMQMNFPSNPQTRVTAMLRPDVRRDLLKELYVALLGKDQTGYFAALPDVDELLAQLNIPLRVAIN